MSDNLINIRIGIYHFQLKNTWKFKVSRNNSHIGYPHGFFKVYEFFGLTQ